MSRDELRLRLETLEHEQELFSHRHARFGHAGNIATAIFVLMLLLLAFTNHAIVAGKPFKVIIAALTAGLLLRSGVICFKGWKVKNEVSDLKARLSIERE
jgi:hypothetical protein